VILHGLQKPFGYLFGSRIPPQDGDGASRGRQDNAVKSAFVKYLPPRHTLLSRKEQDGDWPAIGLHDEVRHIVPAEPATHRIGDGTGTGFEPHTRASQYVV
jgi:hypothetical protein